MIATSQPIRILPMTLAGVEARTIEEAQSQFFLKTLPVRKGCYYYDTSGLDAKLGTIVLFQCDNRIIASAVLEKRERLGGKLYFDVDSIKVFDPVGPALLRDVWPGKFKGFSQVKQSLNAKAFPKFKRRLTGIRVPERAATSILALPTFDKAQELLKPGEIGLFFLTDSRYFKHKPDGSGSTGFWRIDPTRHVDLVVVFHKQIRDGQHFAELFIARHEGVVGPREDGKYTVLLRDVKLAGSTDHSWQEFVGIGQKEFRYVTRHVPDKLGAVTILHDKLQRNAHTLFQTWRRSNPNGFFINDKGAKNSLLHIATCRHLGDTKWTSDDVVGLTEKRKICARTIPELQRWAESQHLSIRLCKDCGPDKHTTIQPEFEYTKVLEKLLESAVYSAPVQARSELAVDDLASPPIGNISPDRALSTARWNYLRDPKVREFVLSRAKGLCEYCGNEGFLLQSGRRFLEAHHIIALAKDGADTPQNVIALCPNHHREAHYGKAGPQLETEMIKRLIKLSSSRVLPD